METSPGRSVYSGLAAFSLITVASMMLWGCGGGGGDEDQPIPLTVSKATCGPNDKPETALQGQVPAALRASGFKGFNCNLQLIGQSKGDGANWQSAEFKDNAGHACAFHGTSFNTADRTHLGVPVIDVTDRTNPTPTAYLTTISMLDPWESLKVNDRRQLLGAVNAHGGAGGSEIDIYDLSGDCRFPQLLASVAVGKADGSTGIPTQTPILGHEGAWAPDGLTYYGADLRFNPIGTAVANGRYYAVDALNATKPNLIATWTTGVAGAGIHGFSIGDDGNRGYFSSTSSIPSFGGVADDLTDPNFAPLNGLLIYDLSEIQARKANPKVTEISRLFWKDGSVAQHSIPVKIAGKPHVIFVDEGGTAGVSSTVQFERACAARLSPFPMARIIDISDEKKPQIVSRLMLETHDPANCDKIRPDLAGLLVFTYGSHYCSVDNKQNATTLACGYFNSGIRVFDIRDPVRPKEIAYFNPPGVTVKSPGSDHSVVRGFIVGGPDWCSAQVHLDATTGTVWSTCHDNGLLMLKFTNGVWPFPTSSTPSGQQN